jgi:hypothetical protein
MSTPDIRRRDMSRRRLRVGRSWVGPALAGGAALVVAGAGAVASLETGTVGSFWRGLWWATALMATVGFIGEPPETVGGAILSVVLMVSGFLLLALVSAALASMFVQDDILPMELREREVDRDLLRELQTMSQRLAALEALIADGSSDLPEDRPD